jgi:hypothetical protein
MRDPQLSRASCQHSSNSVGNLGAIDSGGLERGMMMMIRRSITSFLSGGNTGVRAGC